MPGTGQTHHSHRLNDLNPTTFGDAELSQLLGDEMVPALLRLAAEATDISREADALAGELFPNMSLSSAALLGWPLSQAEQVTCFTAALKICVQGFGAFQP